MNQSVYSPPKSNLLANATPSRARFIGGWLNLLGVELVLSLLINIALIVVLLLEHQTGNSIALCRGWTLNCLNAFQKMELFGKLFFTPAIILLGLVVLFKFIQRRKNFVGWAQVLLALCAIRAMLYVWEFANYYSLNRVLFFAALPLLICTIELLYIQRAKRIRTTFLH